MRSRLAILSVAVPSAVAALLLLNPIPGNSKTPCEAAKEWAAKNREALPATLAEFSQLNLIYRRAAYAEMPVMARRDLWYSHLTSFLSSGTELTPEQRATVHAVAMNLNRYILPDPAASRAALDADGLTAERMAKEFGEMATEIFMTLGPADRATVPMCSCSTVSDFCSNGCCLDSEDPCIPSDTGCGFLWCFPCDGLCYQAGSGLCPPPTP